MGPIDYTQNVVNPMAAAMQGFQFGSLIQQQQAQAEAQQIALQQAQQQQARQQALNDEFGKFRAAPSLEGAMRLSTMLPEKEAESLRKTWGMMDDAQKKSELSFASHALSALKSAKPEIAAIGISQLEDRASSEKDPEKARHWKTVAEIAKADPATAVGVVSMLMGALPGGDKALTGLKTIGEEARAEKVEGREAQMFPAKLTEAQSKAQSAAVAAKFAESEAVLDLQKKNWDITKIQEDIKIAKQNAAIAAAGVAATREGNSIKRQEAQLKLQEMVDKRDQTVRDKAAEVEAARFNIDNMLNTATRVLKTPKSVIRSASGPVASRIPTVSQDTSDFEALVATLGSQAFLSQLPNIKGMGQLSNTEGDKLQAALQNMSLKQSPERLVENVKEAQRLLMKVRGGLSSRYGVPETAPDTPAAKPKQQPAAQPSVMDAADAILAGKK